MTLTDELFDLVGRLDAAGIEYAVCGGLAMAIHGYPRATMDLDLVIEETRLSEAKDIAHKSGYTFDTGEMAFHKGQVRLYRVVKIRDDDHEVIPLDLLLVTPILRSAWATREQRETPRGPIWVLSREGLAEMKELRGSGKDQDDIRHLKAASHES